MKPDKNLIHPLSHGFSTGVPRDVARGSARERDWKKKTIFLNLLAKINRSTEKYHFLLKRALTIIIIIGLLYLKLTDHANVPWAVDIIIFMQGFPETWKLFQGFLQGIKVEKGCSKRLIYRIALRNLNFATPYTSIFHTCAISSHLLTYLHVSNPSQKRMVVETPKWRRFPRKQQKATTPTLPAPQYTSALH
jgi:hypothetical protein